MNDQKNLQLIHPKDTSTPAKPVVPASVEHLLDPELAEGTRTHDAWLNGHI